MFAVIKTGGKQYRVVPEDVLKIEKVAGEAGDFVELSEVLVVGEGGNIRGCGPQPTRGDRGPTASLGRAPRGLRPARSPRGSRSRRWSPRSPPGRVRR